MSMLVDSGWKDWYKAQHEKAWVTKTGNDFENYATSCLEKLHEGFQNPSPVGTLGDGGCDGITADGKTFFACFGSRSKTSESDLVKKMEGDFDRAVDQWDAFEVWNFVTNAKVGPDATKKLQEIRDEHLPGSERPIKCDLWNENRFWTEVVQKLLPDQLDEIFPGVPRAENVELRDLVPLLDQLGKIAPPVETGSEIRPVPLTKMEFNDLSASARFEFDEGRILAPIIEKWLDGQADTNFADKCATSFRGIYESHKKTSSDSAEILERIYTAIGGSDFRHDRKLATSVYGVTSFFFDRCDIFEEPPANWNPAEPNAATN